LTPGDAGCPSASVEDPLVRERLGIGGRASIMLWDTATRTSATLSWAEVVEARAALPGAATV